MEKIRLTHDYSYVIYYSLEIARKEQYVVKPQLSLRGQHDSVASPTIRLFRHVNTEGYAQDVTDKAEAIQADGRIEPAL